jgi:hypothetical protein
MSKQTGMLKEMISQFKLKERSMAMQLPDRYWSGYDFHNQMNAPPGMNDDVA